MQSVTRPSGSSTCAHRRHRSGECLRLAPPNPRACIQSQVRTALGMARGPLSHLHEIATASIRNPRHGLALVHFKLLPQSKRHVLASSAHRQCALMEIELDEEGSNKFG
jgi:hypothetical protein